jgi:hypothetical protein
VLEDSGIEFEIVGGDLQFNRQRNLQGRLTMTGKTFQADIAQLTAGSSATITDGALVQKSLAGETYNFANARPVFKGHALGNDQAYLEWKATSLISLPAVDFTAIASPIWTANNA